MARLPLGGSPHVEHLEPRIFAETLPELLDGDLLGPRERPSRLVPCPDPPRQIAGDVLEAHARQTQARLADALLVLRQKHERCLGRDQRPGPRGELTVQADVHGGGEVRGAVVGRGSRVERERALGDGTLDLVRGERRRGGQVADRSRPLAVQPDVAAEVGTKASLKRKAGELKRRCCPIVELVSLDMLRPQSEPAPCAG